MIKNRVQPSFNTLALTIAVVAVTAAIVTGQNLSTEANVENSLRLPSGQPNLQGVWNFSTLTPLERPDEFAEQSQLSSEEAAEFVRQRMASGNADRRDGKGTERSPGEDADLARAYNDFWYDKGDSIVDTRRTSLITDPPTGKLPPMTAEGTRRARAFRTYRSQGVRGPLTSAKTRPLRERCIWWESEGPPLAPMGAYNANLQLLQNRNYIVIQMEMIHDARIIPLDGRHHISETIRQILGDSRGRWEGDTLVVETTNFRDIADFIDPSSFVESTDYRGTRVHVTLIERIERIGADTLRYRYTVRDPTTWTKSWSGEQFLKRVNTPLYEYACHEGNRGLANVLSGARAQE